MNPAERWQEVVDLLPRWASVDSREHTAHMSGVHSSMDVTMYPDGSSYLLWVNRKLVGTTVHAQTASDRVGDWLDREHTADVARMLASGQARLA